MTEPRAKLGKKFWVFGGVGAAVALALIATSLTVLLQPAGDDIVDDPILPVIAEPSPETAPTTPAPAEPLKTLVNY